MVVIQQGNLMILPYATASAGCEPLASLLAVKTFSQMVYMSTTQVQGCWYDVHCG